MGHVRRREGWDEPYWSIESDEFVELLTRIFAFKFALSKDG